MERAGRRNARNVKAVPSIELHRITTLLRKVPVAMEKNNEKGERMKICIPTETGDGTSAQVYGHFGSAPYFTICDLEDEPSK